MLENQINHAKQRLINLSGQFQQLTQGSVTHDIVLLPQKDAAQKLREVSSERGALLQAEMKEISTISKLSQDRVSLLMRYRSPEADPDGSKSVAIICDDLDFAVSSDHFAAHMLVSLGSYEPLTEEDQTLIQTRINTSLAETKRLAMGAMAGPLSEDEVKIFHSFYDAPDDPMLAYCKVTEELAQSAVKLVELTGKRIENTVNYVACIHSVIVPVFPDHAQGMEQQADVMQQEGLGSFVRMQNLIERAEIYAHQVKVPPVRGPYYPAP